MNSIRFSRQFSRTGKLTRRNRSYCAFFLKTSSNFRPERRFETPATHHVAVSPKSSRYRGSVLRARKSRLMEGFSLSRVHPRRRHEIRSSNALNRSAANFRPRSRTLQSISLLARLETLVGLSPATGGKLNKQLNYEREGSQSSLFTNPTSGIPLPMLDARRFVLTSTDPRQPFPLFGGVAGGNPIRKPSH